MRKKQTGFEADVVDTGRGQGDGGVAQQRVVGRTQAASSDRREASSSAISASITWSRARPSMISSRL
jgi:hypothetical protein